MSHSVPSDSSLADATFLVGVDLVSFDRSELPIYAAPRSLWAEAGHDSTIWGASLDRLFGEPDAMFVASVPLIEEPRDVAVAVDDPLVALGSLSDGLILPDSEHQPALDQPLHDTHAPDMSPVYDFANGSHLLIPVHGGWHFDLAKPDWFYDHHA